MNYTHIYIVIPAYNEQSQIRRVIQQLQKSGFKKIIVVDDHSSDNTYKILEKINSITIVRHSINRGQGAALQTGNEVALSLGAKYIVHFDGDGQHSVRDILPALKKIEAENLDIVIGSRYLQKSTQRDIPLIKRALILGGWIFTKIMTPQIHLTDAHNGFRIMTRSCAKRIIIEYDRMEHNSEIVDKISRLHLSYAEIPAHIHYSKESLAKGTNKPLNALSIVIKVLISKLV